MQVLAPVAARDGYLAARGYALFLASAGLGSVTGGLLMLRWSPRRPLVVCAVATVAFPLPCLALAAGTALWQVTAVYTLLGAAEAVFATLWSTALQHNVPPEVLGRVSSWDFLGSFASLPLGMALAGPLVAGTGLTRALLIAGVAGTGAALLPLLHPRLLGALRAARPGPAPHPPVVDPAQPA
jgi:MFS family permease